jgi:mycothiol synthase
MPQQHFQKLIGEGFKVRPATMDDLEESVAMFNAHARALTGEDEFTVEDYRPEWESPGFDIEASTRVVLSPEGEIVGCVEVWDIVNPPVHPWLWWRVHPDWEGLGIGKAMMRWAIERAREAVDRAPEGARVSARTGCLATDQISKDVLLGLGMQPIRYGWRMLIDLDVTPPDPVWPEGITLQPYQHPQMAGQVYRADKEFFRDHWGYVERDYDEGYKFFMHFIEERPNFDPSLWFLASHKDEIVGIALCYPDANGNTETGWVQDLAVKRTFRRRGLGFALLQHAFGEFHRRGKKSAGLEVDADSLTGATRLYERAGMAVQRQSETYELELRPGDEIQTEQVDG